MIAITLSNSVSAFRSGGIASGTYEVTVQPIENGAYYDVGDGGAYYITVSKTNAVRWMFVLQIVGSGSVDPDDTNYTNYASVNITLAMTAVQVATAVYTAATTLAGFNVTIDGSTLTFTASQTGNLTDSVGFPTPTITPGS